MSRHLRRDELLCYLDGEMSWMRRMQCRRHLRSCWCCRTDLESLESTIHQIVIAQEAVLLPHTPAPPNAWVSFDSLISTELKINSSSTALPPQYGGWWRHAVIAAGVLVVAGILVTRFFAIDSVSAREVIQHVESAEATRELLPTGHVIRQRIHITRSSRTHSYSEDSVVNAWRSESNAVWTSDGKDSAVSSLQRIYAAYQIPDCLPMEGKVLAKWMQLAGGGGSARHTSDGIILDFGDADDSTRPAIELHVTPNAWTVHEMQLTLHDETYRIAEDDFLVMPLDAAPVAIQARLSAPMEPLAAPVRNMAVETPVVLGSGQLKSAELSVMISLHRIQADLGDPITINSTARGINVGLWQLPAERQAQVKSALEGIPSVTVSTVAPHGRTRVASTDEAIALTTEVRAGIQSPAPIESDPRALKLMGGMSAEQSFATLALSKFDAVIAQIYSLNNLAERFDAQNEAALSDDARSELQVLVHDHAGQASAALSDLQNAMVPLTTLYGGMSNDVDVTPQPVSDSWQLRSVHALQMARRTDSLLRGILTSSSTPVDPHLGIPAVQKQLSSLAADVLALRTAQ